jgi:multiple sugar transport system ATP-binding protein
MRPRDRDVAMVFQDHALYPRMTVFGNISLSLRARRMPKREIDERVKRAATMLGIGRLLDRYPRQLSGGQRQRVAIGRAMVKNPKVFMFDEPLSNLDAALRSRTRQEIANLHRRIRTAMVFVTHDQTEAMTLADRIVVMNQRRIEQIGTPAQVYRNPATVFVATFIGSPAMNILPVTRAESNDAYEVVRLGDGTNISTSVPAAAVRDNGAFRIGLRPESVQLCAVEAGETRAIVEFKEFLGDKTHVYLSLASGDRIVAVDGASCPFTRGEAVGVRFDRSAAHLFDAEGLSQRAVK